MRKKPLLYIYTICINMLIISTKIYDNIRIHMDILKEEFLKLKNKDPGAFTRFYNGYKDIAYNYLLIKTKGNKDTAGEILCEVNIAVFRSLGKLKQADNLIGWVIRIAQRTYFNHVKKAIGDQKLFKKLTDPTHMSEPDDNECSENHERKAALFRIAHASLKQRFRDIITLKYIERKSIKELAAILNMNGNAIGSLLSRAKMALKKEIQKLTTDFENGLLNGKMD
jgi:RNA polymerase sigma factor (sigma-70 family)